MEFKTERKCTEDESGLQKRKEFKQEEWNLKKGKKKGIQKQKDIGIKQKL